ncbi:hypothetical protein C8D70_10810 [Chryseobacterium sp. CBTAP 102]|uniref:DUF5677 domain-containing protein n=1 Tax=Chryseobacterium TaxID=59732 RepID=UPI00083B2F9D|nr:MULTISPECIES: DUF5677 domain-containing protein [Chryseobacterium]PXW13607.1 hypothetical protein C8D70_10810 [Chryseobacterium sp. CBTAP 102]UHO37106.1 hypothetical protein H5J24_15235 [Chryseobacterium capnotolerans]
MTDKDKIETLFEIASTDLPIIKNHLDVIVKTLADLIQLYKNEINPDLDFGEAYIETLNIKILLATNTALQLANGQNLKVLDKEIQVIDISSLYVVARTIIECFLTIEYLFINDILQAERDFRFKLWKIAGYMMRQQAINDSNKIHSAKIESEKEEIDKLKKDVKESEFYSQLSKQEIWKLDAFGIPRTLSWSKLLNKSSINNNLLDGYYKLYSNYAHSEFVSIMQLKQMNLNTTSPVAIDNLTYTLNNIRIINCVVINLFLQKFDQSKEIYERFDAKTKYIIDFWNSFATK